MTSSNRRIAAPIAFCLAGLVAVFVTSCTSHDDAASDGPSGHQNSDQPAISGQPAGFNADDVAFVTNMIPHHQQAVELSAMASAHTTNAELTQLAQKISAAQKPEINAMRVLEVQWTENPGDNTAGSATHAGHDAMAGMVDQATMDKLQTLRGAAFDTLWLQSMIGHHEGAIEMAKAEIASGGNVDAKDMAQSMIDSQQAEITQMKQMLGGGQNGR